MKTLTKKNFSKIINRKLLQFLDSQHGFRSKRGINSLIANMYERIAREKDDKKTLITIVTRDISKAFDKVDRESLIH